MIGQMKKDSGRRRSVLGDDMKDNIAKMQEKHKESLMRSIVQNDV
jgi:hypothetical protein